LPEKTVTTRTIFCANRTHHSFPGEKHCENTNLAFSICFLLAVFYIYMPYSSGQNRRKKQSVGV